VRPSDRWVLPVASGHLTWCGAAGQSHEGATRGVARPMLVANFLKPLNCGSVESDRCETFRSPSIRAGLVHFVKP
jgi:hypothetical protein